MSKSRLVLLVMVLIIGACSPQTETLIPTPSSLQASTEQPTSDSSPAPEHTSTTETEFERARQELVSTGIVPYGISDPAVIDAMGRVARHEFVPEDIQSLAYLNRPLPIGYGQTISQPYIVALMTQELELSEGDRVLEIGTGSGYQGAILAEIGVDVFTIEIIGPLADAVLDRYLRLGYVDIETRHGDGYYGWREEGPFDAIIVTAAPDHVPPPLLEQLKIGGVMVIPVGPVGGYQELWKITRIEENKFERKSLGGVRFVPFTRLGEEPSDQEK
jgi:protein-L-isoaspartate(D-aspartate) O-methyltransferase